MVPADSALHPGLVDNPLITVVPLPLPPKVLLADILPFIIAGPLKVLWQIWSLFNVLGYKTRPVRWLLVQVITQTSPLDIINKHLLEPSIYSHTFHRYNSMLHPKYPPDN